MPDNSTSLDSECFFIAPIGKEGTSERNRSDGVLEFIVGRAAQELGLTAVRGDQISEPGQITLQIIDHVLGAKAAVADLTFLNPNVFYELAVRHTARLPTALIAEKDCALPFDIAQMRTIFFDHTDLRSADSCRIAIVAQLREALDKGMVDSPIATSIDVRALQGGNKAERNIAELITVTEDIAKIQRQTLQQVNQLRADAERQSPTSRKSIRRLQNMLDDLIFNIGILERQTDPKNDEDMWIIVQRIKSISRLINSGWGAQTNTMRNEDVSQEHLSFEPTEIPFESKSPPDN